MMTGVGLKQIGRGRQTARRVGLCLLLLAVLLKSHPATHAQVSLKHGTTNLTLAEFLGRVVARNESVQQKLLEMAAKQQQARGEYGVFEPELFGQVEREATKRENTVEQFRSTFSDYFEEQNNFYQGGIESLVPTGARVRLGYSIRDINNNLQDQLNNLFRGATNGEYQTFVGVTVAQPLLKNFGPSATMAGIRVAALGSKQAFQEYRRQLMIVVGTAEASYWNLYLAQEQVRFFQESVATAEKILADNVSRMQAGKGSQLEVLESEAGLALRRSKLGDAEQKLYDTAGRLLSLSGESVLATTQFMHAVERPRMKEFNPAFFESWRSFYDHNPDYLIQQQKVLQELVRLGYARNQRLPDLSLKGSYGYNGLGESPADSWGDIEEGGFPSWSIGVELRIPLAGGLKVAGELAAARLRYRAALVGLQEVTTHAGNSINTAISKIQSTRQSVRSYQTVVDFNESLLTSALARLELGRIESRKVLDIEEDLFDSRNSFVEAEVQHERALLELAMLEGSVLRTRNLDLTHNELMASTDRLLRGRGLSEPEYETFLRDLQGEFARHESLARVHDTPPQGKARAAVLQVTHPVLPWSATNTAPVAMDPEQERALREGVRRAVEELNRNNPPPARK